jgi:hypothetical protein
LAKAAEDDGKQTAGGANIRRQSRIICERVEARRHRYLPEAAASLQAGAKHCGQDNAHATALTSFVASSFVILLSVLSA